MFPVMTYNWVVNKGELANRLEHDWLRYQLDNGKKTRKALRVYLDGYDDDVLFPFTYSG